MSKGLGAKKMRDGSTSRVRYLRQFIRTFGSNLFNYYSIIPYFSFTLESKNYRKQIKFCDKFVQSGSCRKRVHSHLLNYFSKLSFRRTIECNKSFSSWRLNIKVFEHSITKYLMRVYASKNNNFMLQCTQLIHVRLQLVMGTID